MTNLCCRETMSQHSTASTRQPGSGSRPSLHARLLALMVAADGAPAVAGASWSPSASSPARRCWSTGCRGRPRERVRRAVPARRAGRLRGLGLRARRRDVVGQRHWSTCTSTWRPQNLHSDAPQGRGGDLSSCPSRLLANVLAGQARLRAAESEQRRREAEASHAEASALAEQQAALRRVATLVARGADPTEVYPAAVAELARGLDVEHVTLRPFRLRRGTATVLAAHDDQDVTKLQSGERLSLDGDNVAGTILHTGTPRSDRRLRRRRRAHRRADARARTALGGRCTRHRRRPHLGRADRSVRRNPNRCPRTPRLASAISPTSSPPPSPTPRPGPSSRRRGRASSPPPTRPAAASNAICTTVRSSASCRSVLELRTLEASVPPRTRRARAARQRHQRPGRSLHGTCRRLSRGIHPAILSKGGLGPAIKTLARRSVVPVELDLDVDRRLPESIEVAAYYVVAEALTNAAKHAEASEVQRERRSRPSDELRITVADDGIGGACRRAAAPA